IRITERVIRSNASTAHRIPRLPPWTRPGVVCANGCRLTHIIKMSILQRLCEGSRIAQNARGSEDFKYASSAFIPECLDGMCTLPPGAEMSNGPNTLLSPYFNI